MSKNMMIASAGIALGLAALGAAGYAVWNSKQLRAARAVKRFAFLGDIGSEINKFFKLEVGIRSVGIVILLHSINGRPLERFVTSEKRKDGYRQYKRQNER